MLPFLHRLRPTAMPIAAATLASSPSLSFRNPRLSFYHNPVVVNRSLIASSPRSSSFPNANVRRFAAAAAAEKVRVLNPIVEMDGELIFFGRIGISSSIYFDFGIEIFELL